MGDLKSKHEFAAGHRWASIIDFASGYYAIALDDESVPYAAFYVEGRGYYVYLRMPFGLTGAPATFCEMVAIALDDMIGRELTNWMDDVCIPGDDFDVKLGNLRKFFQRCRDRKLSLSPSKTKLFATEVLFAGVIVGPNGIKPNPDKVAAVVDWPEPENVQELMGFLGLTNYFRRLICDYARIAAPLTDLTRNVQAEIPRGTKTVVRKGAYKRALRTTKLKGKWGQEQQKAFVTLKCLLSQEPLVRPPQYDGRPFRVTTDGCAKGLAGFLSQPFKETNREGKEVTRWYPIAYCSKRTSPSEERYEPFLLEFAALKFSLDEFDQYVFGSPIELETDCQALRDCLMKEKMSVHHSRWKESILAHNIIDIRHRPGIENPVADGLSRKWEFRKPRPQDGSEWSVLPDWETAQGIRNDIMSLTDREPQQGQHPLETRFKDDAFFQPIVQHLLGRRAGETISECKRARHRAEGFMIEDGKLWRVSAKADDRAPRTECIPSTEGFQQALQCHRDHGHFGVDLVKLQLHDHFFWPGMDRDSRQAILECPRCKNFGLAHINALLQPIKRSQLFALAMGDYLSLPNGKGGFKTVGLYIDAYSQFLFYTKLKTAGTGKSTVGSLRRICGDYATPAAFMSDGGSHFDNKEVDSFCEANGIQKIVTPAYSPWVNGLIENANKLLLGRLKRLCAPDIDAEFDNDNVDPKSIPTNWPDHIDKAIQQLNDRIIPALKATPRELLFGMRFQPTRGLPDTHTQTTIQETQTNLSLTEILRMGAHQRQLEEAKKRKAAFDKKVGPPEVFGKGDLVQVYDSTMDKSFNTANKLKPRWSTPLMITAKFSNSYALCTLDGSPLPGKYHARRLRHYIPLRGSALDYIGPLEEPVPDPEEEIEESTVKEAENRMEDTQ
jgi:hypothetical protein